MMIAWDNSPLPPKSFSALVLGGLVGGALTPVSLAIGDGQLTVLALFPIVAPVAAIVWLVGLVVVGLPGWFLLHRLRLRSAWAAAGLGLVALSPAFFIGSFELSRLLSASAFVLMGPAVGWVIWRIAYGRAAS